MRRRNFCAARFRAIFTEPPPPQPRRYQDRYGVKITCSQETEPLGTAGPIALAQPLLDDGEPFFVMNCDVACHFSMKGLLDFHRAHGKVGTIMVTRVEEPAKYGKSVVLSHETGLIDRFVEHGRTYHGNWINAGVYIFSPSIFERIALRPTSMEREVLPELAADDQLYSRQLDGFWMNVKKPREWIEGNALYLSHLRTERPAALLAAGGGDGGDGGSSSGDRGRPAAAARLDRVRLRGERRGALGCTHSSLEQSPGPRTLCRFTRREYLLPPNEIRPHGSPWQDKKGPA